MKFIIALLAAVLIVATITRARGVRRFLHILLGVLAVYAVLKVTGVIDAIDLRQYGIF